MSILYVPRELERILKIENPRTKLLIDSSIFIGRKSLLREIRKMPTNPLVFEDKEIRDAILSLVILNSSNIYICPTVKNELLDGVDKIWEFITDNRRKINGNYQKIINALESHRALVQYLEQRVFDFRNELEEGGVNISYLSTIENETHENAKNLIKILPKKRGRPVSYPDVRQVLSILRFNYETGLRATNVFEDWDIFKIAKTLATKDEFAKFRDVRSYKLINMPLHQRKPSSRIWFPMNFQ